MLDSKLCHFFYPNQSLDFQCNQTVFMAAFYSFSAAAQGVGGRAADFAFFVCDDLGLNNKNIIVLWKKTLFCFHYPEEQWLSLSSHRVGQTQPFRAIL